MRQQKRIGETVSLGAYLGELRAGSACICCAAPLQWTGGDEVSPYKDRTRSRLEKSGVLGCPECGCEISRETTESESVAGQTHRGLNRAA